MPSFRQASVEGGGSVKISFGPLVRSEKAEDEGAAGSSLLRMDLLLSRWRPALMKMVVQRAPLEGGLLLLPGLLSSSPVVDLLLNVERLRGLRKWRTALPVL